MAQALRTSTFVPPGLVVDRVDQTGEAVVVIVRSSTPTSLCPGCLAPSKRIHSRYRRRLSDLPWAGRSVQLVLLARRFYCDAVLCGRRISPSASRPRFWRHGVAVRRVWIISCTTLAWL